MSEIRVITYAREVRSIADGHIATCDRCGHQLRVSHLDWTAIVCLRCRADLFQRYSDAAGEYLRENESGRICSWGGSIDDGESGRWSRVDRRESIDSGRDEA